MLTRKSGLLALVVGAAAFLGACESKQGDIIIPPQHVDTTVTISPNPVPQLKKGQTQQLIAVVSGTGTQSVTWSVLSGGTAVSVSATGLVTALNPGVAVVQAVSTVNPNAKAAVSISVADTLPTGGGTTVGQPTISITSVTVNGPNGLNQPVNPAAVAGTIDVTITYDIPAGTNVSAVRATIDGTEVCRQSFATGSSADAAVEAVPQQFVCTVNTARLGTNGVAAFLNGVHTLRAELLNPTGGVVASATYQPLTFANADVVAVNVTTTKAPVAGPGGFAWRAGDVTVTLTPAIYTGTPNALTSVTVALTPSANAAIQGTAGGNATGDFNAGCSTTRTVPAGFGAAPAPATATCAAGSITKTATTFTNNVATVTFPASANFAGAGVGNLEDPNLGISITGLTAAGNNFAGAGAFTVNGVALTGANPLRLDNLAPRFTKLDITPASVGCAPSTSCYLNGSFSFTAANNTTPTAANTAATIDYGVDLQTTTFSAGTSSTTLTTVSNPSTLPETAVSNTDILAATTTDAQGNTRTNFATANAACPSASSTSGSAANQTGGCQTAGVATTIQNFGVDLTPPTMTTTGFADQSTAAAPGASNTITFAASDAATPPAGPSGIAGISVKVEQITPAGTTCLDPRVTPAGTGAFGATASACGTGSTVLMANPATVTLPDVNAYYRVTATPIDLSGNAGTTVVRTQLRDFTAPSVGGISCPSTIAGNTDVSCSVFASDNIDLGDLLSTVQYTGGLVELEYARTGIGSYGFDVFSTTNAAAPNFTIPGFIRSIQTTNGAGAPNAFAANTYLADFVNAYVRDVAGVQLANQCVVGAAGPAANTSTQNCTRRQDQITANVQQGIGAAAEPSGFESAGRAFGTGTNNGGTAFTQSGAATSVCSDNPAGAAAGCAVVTARSVTLTATATGPALTFANPFARVLFFATDPVSGRSFQVCAASATSVTDNTTVGTRTWTYSCTWTPTVPANAAPYNTFALGVDTSGRALMTNTRAITITSD